MVVAIDPGANQGWAVFRFGRLAACGLGEGVLPGSPDRVVVERPHAHRTRARVRDIMTLALRAGAAGERYGTARGTDPEFIEPGVWKGTLDKDQSAARVRARLDPGERAILEQDLRGIAATKQHNVLDAVGIGLWAVGR